MPEHLVGNINTITEQHGMDCGDQSIQRWLVWSVFTSHTISESSVVSLDFVENAFDKITLFRLLYTIT